MSFRDSRPEEFGPNIKLKPETERAFANLDFDSVFESFHRSYRLIAKHEAWCARENSGRRHLRKIEPELDQERPIAKTLKNYLEELRGVVAELPEDSLARPVRAHVVQAFEIKTGKRSSHEVALVEIVNRNGDYLSFDGQSLEVHRGGPVFSEVSSPIREEIQAVRSFFSQEALEERCEALTTSVLPTTIETYSHPGEIDPQLLFELGVAIEAHLYSPESTGIPKVEDIQVLGQGDSANTLQLKFEGQSLEAKLFLDEFGLLDIVIARRSP